LSRGFLGDFPLTFAMWQKKVENRGRGEEKKRRQVWSKINRECQSYPEVRDKASPIHVVSPHV
jgi:hypothetical protein